MKKAKHQKAKRLIQNQVANKKLKTKWQIGLGRDIIIGPLSLCTIFKCGSTDQKEEFKQGIWSWIERKIDGGYFKGRHRLNNTLSPNFL